MKIFLSYGHDEYAEFASRLKRDLETEGMDVWIDKNEIKGTADWEIAIEEGITTSDWIVLLMTEHSVRRPDGVCLDEVSFARFLGKNIAPIMVQDVKPPLCIARIQWVDMKGVHTSDEMNDKLYQAKKEELISILKGIQRHQIEGEHLSLITVLDPLDNDVYSENFRKDFFGREILFSYFDEWIKNDSKILWLVGDAGIGKTAFIAKLTQIREEIQAVHFCRYNDNERANPKRAILSIAYYLSTQIEEYKNQIMQLKDLHNLMEKSTSRLFEYLIVEPLTRVKVQESNVVIIIDALDEATVDGKNELAEIVAKQFSNTPSWLKLLITSRKEPLLERTLSKYHSIDFNNEKFVDNQSDVRGYFEMQLTDYLNNRDDKEAVLSQLVKKSEGIFLYAKTVVDEIKADRITLDDFEKFPEGLTGIYMEYFNRIFDTNKSYSYKSDVRPIMEVVCTSYMPVSAEDITSIVGIDEYDLEDIIDDIYEMITIKSDKIEPVHKSIVDWMLDGRKSGKYRVSSKKGHERIAAFYSQHRDYNYALTYLTRHFILSNNFSKAIELMSDKAFQKNRIDSIGLDSSIRIYLLETELLKRVDDSCSEVVLESDTFFDLFTEYRKFFYNSGLYFYLRELGFDDVLLKGRSIQEPDTRIGIAYYYYITESYDKAVIAVKDMLDIGGLPPEIEAEAHNLIALCYRKSVDFDKAKDHFKKAYATGDENIMLYDKSISVINLGKIAYHEHDWEAAAHWNKKAIDLLLQEREKAETDDYRTSIDLFIAEYHRLTAECLIWNQEIEAVNQELDCANEIYQQVTSRDRYYVRYLYTSVFRDILAGEYEKAIRSCQSVEKNATSQYDKSQIAFYKGIAALKLGQKEEIKNALKKGYKFTSQIGAWLELGEFVQLAILADVDISTWDIPKNVQENRYINNWRKHVVLFIESLR